MNWHYSAPLVLISIAIFMVMWVTAYFNRNSKLKSVSTCDGVILLVLTAFSVFAFYDTDYFTYYISYKRMFSARWHALSHMELGYQWIAMVITNYSLFRLVVWGTAVWLFQSAVRHLKLNLHQVLFILLSVCVLKFSYGRVSLAMAMMYWGASRIIEPGKNVIWSRILGIGFIVLSFYFHKSAPFGIVMVFLGMLPMQKKLFISSLVAFPIIVAVLQLFLAYVMDLKANDASVFAVDAAQRYMSGKEHSHGIGMMVQRILERTPYYIVVIIYGKCLLRNKMDNWSYAIRSIANSAFFTIYVSSIFLLDLAVQTSIIYYRFLYFSMIPAVMFLGYCYTHNVYRKWVLAAVCIGFTAECYNLLYSFYVS